MDFAVLFSQVVGPLLLIRVISIVLDRRHFLDMLEGAEREVTSVAFSFFPIALFVFGATIAASYSDYSSAAAILIHLIAWGAIIKATALMLIPRAVAAKARLLVRAGFLNVVLLVCLAAGGYFTWFGYLASGSG